jgi:integrase
MAGRVRHLLERKGRYYARVAVPAALRPALGNRNEFQKALGSDRTIALRNLAAAVAEFQALIDGARQTSESQALPGQVSPPPPHLEALNPMSVAEIATELYEGRLATDEAARNQTHAYAAVGIDDLHVAELRAGIGGKLSDAAIIELVGDQIDYFRDRGNTSVIVGSPEWRELARAICKAEYTALERIVERDEGEYTGITSDPLLNAAKERRPNPTEASKTSSKPVSLDGLFRDYVAARQIVGKGRGAEKRWAPVFANLRGFLRHDDALRLTKRDVIAWRNKLLESLAPTTVARVHLSALRTVLNWSVGEDRIVENVTVNVKQDIPTKALTREKGFTDSEAEQLLRASWRYAPNVIGRQKIRELPQTTAAKRWVPLICAFTGARVGEITQLRRQDFRQEGGIHVMRIDPNAGTVKAGGFRDVPLHSQLVDLGLLAFVDAACDGPLFYRSANIDGSLKAARVVSGRISKWARETGLVPDSVAPNHGWRHRFKTVGRERGVSDVVLDAICGHAGRSAGDKYGDVTIAAKAREIEKFPRYDLG